MDLLEQQRVDAIGILSNLDQSYSTKAIKQKSTISMHSGESKGSKTPEEESRFDLIENLCSVLRAIIKQCDVQTKSTPENEFDDSNMSAIKQSHSFLNTSDNDY